MVLAIIEDEGPARGLHLNRGKSLLYIPKDCPFNHNPLPQDIPISRSGFVLLGSPIGPPSFCEMIAMKRVQKIQDLLTQLPDPQDSQWKLLSFVPALLSLKSLSLSAVVHPITFKRLFMLLTT